MIRGSVQLLYAKYASDFFHAIRHKMSAHITKELFRDSRNVTFSVLMFFSAAAS